MTVRVRVTLLATVVVAAVLVATGFALVWQQRHVLTEALAESLQERWDELEAYGADPPDVLTGLGADDAVAQVVREPDEVLASSANLQGSGPLVTEYGGLRYRNLDHLPHEDGRFRALVDQAPGVRIVVAAPLDDIDESVTALQRSLLIGIPLVVAALALLLWWVVGRALRPVEAIRSEVAQIDARDLHRRVPVPAADDEVGRLARTMNDMLERIDDATQRQRRFVADASHELRSPLTRMRTELEVDLAHPDGADLAATHQSVLEETIGLQRLADDLLLVARADERGAPGEAVPVDLDDVVLRVARRLRADDRVQVDLAGVSAGHVHGDRDQLTRVVSNLADNAVRHASSVVRFTLAERDGRVALTVEDDGPGVPVADRERIFERFARVDNARSTDGGGTGLGLAIARDLAEAHGGTLVLAPTTTGAHFVLTLPAAQ